MKIFLPKEPANVREDDHVMGAAFIGVGAVTGALYSVAITSETWCVRIAQNRV
jgi:hypothetical protein